MCNMKDYFLCTVLLVCVNGIYMESRRHRKATTYTVNISQKFCEPCTTLSTCQDVEKYILPILEELLRWYGKSKDEINKSYTKVIEQHKTFYDDHPINIRDLEYEQAKIRLMRHGPLNNLEKMFLRPFEEVTMLAAYLQLASNIVEDIKMKAMTESLEKAMKNLSSASCRLKDLFQLLNITTPKQICQFERNITLNSTTGKIKYVLSVLKHGMTNIQRLSQLNVTKDKICDLFNTEDPETSAVKSKGEERIRRHSRKTSNVDRMASGHTELSTSEEQGKATVDSNTDTSQTRKSRKNKRRRKNKKRRRNKKRCRKNKKKDRKDRKGKNKRCRRKKGGKKSRKSKF